MDDEVVVAADCIAGAALVRDERTVRDAEVMRVDMLLPFEFKRRHGPPPSGSHFESSRQANGTCNYTTTAMPSVPLSAAPESAPVCGSI